MKQARQPPLRAGPRLCAQLAEHLGLRLGPQRPRAGQGSSSLVRDLYRPDSPVGMRSTLEQPIPLQEGEAARQCRLVDGESTLELLQVRLAQVRDGRENTELRHPETARPQDIVIELRHRATDHSQRGADTGRQAAAALLKPRRSGQAPPTGEMMDNNGKPIYFDSVDNSAYILGKAEHSARDSWIYIDGETFLGVRADVGGDPKEPWLKVAWKYLYTAKDSWLGATADLGAIGAMYNLTMDPYEKYDMTFNGAADTRVLSSSPGKYAGQDNA